MYACFYRMFSGVHNEIPDELTIPYHILVQLTSCMRSMIAWHRNDFMVLIVLLWHFST
jgi:hypothetical protein